MCTSDIEKESKINKILLHSPVDICAIRIFAHTVGGFLNNRIRSRVWPKLLGVNRYNILDYKRQIFEHRDKIQLHCDIERSLYNIGIFFL